MVSKMGRWIKEFRKYRVVDLILGLAMIAVFLYLIGLAEGIIGQLPTEGYISVMTFREKISALPTMMWYLFILGILAGSFLTTYVILELTKES